MSTQVLFKNLRPNRIATLEEYRASGGYEALTTTLGKFTRPQVQQLALDAVLLGRGGAVVARDGGLDAGGDDGVAQFLHALARGTGEADFYRAKVETARFYFQRILPRTESLALCVEAGGAPLMALPEAHFAL